jgi:uncharacterized repeat protein (TIGR03843 family)
VHVLWTADGSGWASLSSDELTQPAGDHVDPLRILNEGEIEIVGRMPWSSNATFLITVRSDGDEARAIYKPGRGERPLWDFPSGLYRREAAAYLLSEALGVGAVPPTVLRHDAPLGVGSIQWFVEADFQQHYFTLQEGRPETHDQFRALAAFDVVANNTDRKSGHCLIDRHGKVWAIDQGLCFSVDFKLRTVIWEFGGEPLPEALRGPLAQLSDTVPLHVAALLEDDEIEALQERAGQLVDAGRLPTDPTGRRYPWPLV